MLANQLQIQLVVGKLFVCLQVHKVSEHMHVDGGMQPTDELVEQSLL